MYISTLRPRHTQPPQQQKFFGSFFQKRTASFAFRLKSVTPDSQNIIDIALTFALDGLDEVLP
jgi:hypothetical protein